MSQYFCYLATIVSAINWKLALLELVEEEKIHKESDACKSRSCVPMQTKHLNEGEVLLTQPRRPMRCPEHHAFYVVQKVYICFGI